MQDFFLYGCGSVFHTFPRLFHRPFHTKAKKSRISGHFPPKNPDSFVAVFDIDFVFVFVVVFVVVDVADVVDVAVVEVVVVVGIGCNAK